MVIKSFQQQQQQSFKVNAGNVLLGLNGQRLGRYFILVALSANKEKNIKEKRLVGRVLWG